MINDVRRVLAQLLLVVCFFTCAGLVVAQEKTGQVSGTVLDDTGAAIPGARITASTPGLPRELEASSDGAGLYVFPTLPPGLYTITVSKTGFATVKQHNIQVSLGSKIIFNPKLTVGTVTQTIEVSESSLSLDVTSSRASTNITPDTIATLPKSRNFNSLLAMAPGVRLEAKSGSAGVGGISVDGASGSENVFIIDGVEVSDTLNGSLRGAFNVPFEFLAEIQVKSGGFEAEYGGATGGVLNLATRSGSNEYHGELNFQFTSNQLNPRPRGFWQGSPASADVRDFFAPVKDTYRKMYPGFTLGGPFVRNRLYFFAGYMPEFVRTFRVNKYVAGTREYEQETIQHFSLGKL